MLSGNKQILIIVSVAMSEPSPTHDRDTCARADSDVTLESKDVIIDIDKVGDSTTIEIEPVHQNINMKNSEIIGKFTNNCLFKKKSSSNLNFIFIVI